MLQVTGDNILLFLWFGDLAIICGIFRRFTAFYGVLRRFTAFYGVLRRFTAFYGVLRRFTVFYGVLRRFTVFSGVLVIRFIVGPNIWGSSNPSPLFWLVENNRAKMGRHWPPFPPENMFSGFFPCKVHEPYI